MIFCLLKTALIAKEMLHKKKGGSPPFFFCCLSLFVNKDSNHQTTIFNAFFLLNTFAFTIFYFTYYMASARIGNPITFL